MPPEVGAVCAAESRQNCAPNCAPKYCAPNCVPKYCARRTASCSIFAAASRPPTTGVPSTDTRRSPSLSDSSPPPPAA